MADSDITVSGLAASGGVGQISLTWSIAEASCLSYLRLDKVEVWVSATNDRAGAVKIGEVFGTQFVHTGLPRSTARRYWIRPRDVSGNIGEWFPVSATVGIAGTTTSNTPNANALSDVSQNAGDINAGNVSGVTITGSLIRTRATGARIELNGAANALYAYEATGGFIAQIRADAGETVANFQGLQSQVVLNARNDGSGAAARFIGVGNIIGVLDVENWMGGAGRNAAYIRNSAPGGGAAYIGRSGTNNGYAVYAQSGGIAPFTGQHDALLAIGTDFDFGDIVIDLKVIARNAIDDTLTVVTISDARMQRGALGVVSRRVPLDPTIELAALRRSASETSDAPTTVMRLLSERYDLLAVNSVGEGQINVCGRGGDIRKGDLLVASSMRGKAERQEDDIMRGITVAKAREDVTFSHPDEWRRVACIYHCG